MAFTGNENHEISLEEAAKLTANFRESSSAGTTLGSFFGKTALSKILNQTGCVGMRVYNAKSEDGKAAYVLVGVDAKGEDLEDGSIAEYGMGCPPNCAVSSALAGTK